MPITGKQDSNDLKYESPVGEVITRSFSAYDETAELEVELANALDKEPESEKDAELEFELEKLWKKPLSQRRIHLTQWINCPNETQWLKQLGQ